MNIKDLSDRIEKIETRNHFVEQNKAWETSWTRKILVAFFTYFAIASYLKFIVGINPWINAIVPSVAFLLSTLTLPWFKKLWLHYMYNVKKTSPVFPYQESECFFCNSAHLASQVIF